jgi:quercetin dioxygenase-like cupin family protein
LRSGDNYPGDRLFESLSVEEVAMRRMIFQVGCAVLLTLPTVPGRADGPPRHPQEVEAEGLMVKRSEITGTAPVADLGVARYWAVEKGEHVWSLLVEVSGTIPLHFHPDGVHRMYILEGRLRCTVGREAMEMGPGDYMLIPRGVRHRFEKVGDGRAYFVTVDTPPINPANNVWLEPAPRKVAEK